MPVPNRSRDRSYAGDMMDEGKEAELIVLDFLQKRPNVLTISDAREDSYWQFRDVDFVCGMIDGTTRLIEAKSDRHLGKSPNIFFELARINHTADVEHAARIGWTQFSHAESFMIWNPDVRLLYIIGASDLRRAMQRYTQTARQNTRITWVSTDSIKSTVGILIPMEYVSYQVYTREYGVWRFIDHVRR